MATNSSSPGVDLDKLAKMINSTRNPSLSFFDKLSDAALDTAGTLTNLGKSGIQAAEGSLKVWRTLSGAGANFSNDIIGMSASAAKGRMSLEEFGEVVQNNAKNFTGLGANVTRGAEKFAQFSEEMAKGGTVDNLRQLGYTSKEANELLALQLATTRSSQALDEAGRKRAIDATMKLALEMDLTSKLTGKTRKDQEEKMKALQLDAQVENKIRLETRGMNQKDAAEYRTNVMRMLTEAQQRGTGEMAKERFATGTVTSEIGATQAAMNAEEFAAMDMGFKAIKNGQTELAKSYEMEAKAANLRAQDDPTRQMIGSLGEAGGTAATVINQVTAENRGLYDATKRVREEMEKQGQDTSDYRKVLEETIRQAQQPQQGIGADGKRQDGAVQGALAVGKAFEDGRALLATGLEASFKTAAQDGGKILADSIKSAFDSVYGATEKSLKALDQLNSGIPTTNEQLGVVGTGINLVKGAAEGLVGLFKTGEAKTQVKIGAFGEGGFVDKPQLAVVGDVPEHIVPKGVMESIITSATNAGMQAVSGMTPAASKDTSQSTYQPKLDLSEFSKNIKTSISSISSGGAASTVSAKDETDSTLKIRQDYAKKEEEFKLIGLKEGVEAEQAARKQYAKEFLTGMKDEADFTLKIRQEYAKKEEEFKLIGLKEGVQAEQKARERYAKEFLTGVKQQDPTKIKEEKTQPKFLGPDGQINLDMFGGSSFGKDLQVGGVSSIAKNVQQSAAKEENQSAAETARLNRQGATKPAATAAPDPKAAPGAASGTKAASLDDVVDSLDMLNKQMGQLINQQADLLNKQIRTTRDSNSSNVYDKMTP